MSRQRSKKSRSYIIVKDYAKTEPMAPPGVANENIQIETDSKNENKEEGRE